jgi:predicted nuclease of predicted toxin-antitoxin system
VRLLANENFPGAAVQILRNAGHDVAWIRTEAPGSSDRDVLERAIAEKRVLVTFDKDFGELASQSTLPDECGVVLFRIRLRNPARASIVIADILRSRDDWAGKFSVVEPARIRMRPLPL